MKVILTFLITSLLWIGGYYIYTETIQQENCVEEQDSRVDYSNDIIGQWTPIENAECKLEFTKYGVLKQYVDILGVKLSNEYPYVVDKDIVIITQDDDTIDFPIVVYTNEDGTFLEIYAVTKLSGKYKKVVPKPKKTSSSVGKTLYSTNKNSTKPKIEQPKQTPTPKAEQPKAPAKNYAELICGYWKPAEGNQYPLEISKYGTVVQWMIYPTGGKDEWSREAYTISGNKLNIDDGYYKCTVEVLNEGGTTYLEVYGHEKYAGKYKKGK